uniref:Uncharacterized protein n=1 Tax=Rhizophora mucronata TaxID=61149 RepID=A0A2P2KAW2_RHIMU
MKTLGLLKIQVRKPQNLFSVSSYRSSCSADGRQKPQNTRCLSSPSSDSLRQPTTQESVVVDARDA